MIPLLAAALLLAVLAGAAFASGIADPDRNQAPLTQGASPAPEAPPTAEELAHAVERLAAAGIATDADTVAGLAADHGLGGAVRLLAWANQTGMSVDEIVAMRVGDADTPPMGWGRIAKQLGVHPGIGRIMGQGGGHGRETAPGQNRP